MTEADSKLLSQYPLIKVEELAYAHNKPEGQASFKTRAEDFIVRETLSFEPEGEGTHAYLYIEKINTNTEWLARQLARFVGIEAKEIGYAGLKDRNALTYQWFSVKLEGIEEPDWDSFQLEGIKIVTKTWHRKKLKRGAIKHNQFEIVLRDVSNTSLEALNKTVSRIQATGVPNYFAQQRFGHDYNNLTHAAQWFNGTRKMKKRADKSMLLSAARSMVYNQMLSERIQQLGWDALIDGEVMMLNGTHSIFSCPEIDETIKQRFHQGDIHPTCPLWGRGNLTSQKQLLQMEQQVAATLTSWCEGLEQQGLKQERRAARLFPEDLLLIVDTQTSVNSLENIKLSFSLPTGSYATAVLRELIQF